MSKKLTLYHGTNVDFDVIDLSKSKNFRDFGRGFYLTTSLEQAEEWAYKTHRRTKSGTKLVLKYTILHKDLESLYKMDLTGQESLWLTIVSANRNLGGIQHFGVTRDVVIGNVADGSDLLDTVDRYNNGIINASQAYKLLKPTKYTDQYSFHTQHAIQFLKKVGFEKC